jgi:hypothetical protein
MIMDDLTEIEQNAYEMIKHLQRRYVEDCAPYYKILSDFHNLRTSPRAYFLSDLGNVKLFDIPLPDVLKK